MDIESWPLASVPGISESHKNKLLAANIRNAKEFLLAPAPDLARKLRIQLDDVYAITDVLCREIEDKPRPVAELVAAKREHFTTGDALLDQALGGGIRLGMIWELCGENSSGKTQLAFQLSLTVQLPPRFGGLSGSCCYLTSNSALSTTRLKQIIDNHPLLSPNNTDLANIHTIHLGSPDALINVLTYRLLGMIIQLKETRPLRLIVLDSIASLFRADGKTTTLSLVQRSKLAAEVSARLRAFAMTHRIAVVVINEVTDAFFPLLPDPETEEVMYQHQNQFIARASTIPGESRKEASMGLSWTNQINARIMMSRTDRRRWIEGEENNDGGSGRHAKRRRISTVAGVPTYEDIHASVEQTAVLRRLSILFAPVSSPISLDFIITSAGVQGIELDDSYMSNQTLSPSSSRPRPPPTTSSLPVPTPAVDFGTKDVEVPQDEFNPENESFWKEVDEISHSEAVDARESQQAEDAPLLDPKALRSEDSFIWDQVPDLSQYVSVEQLNALSSSSSQLAAPNGDDALELNLKSTSTEGGEDDLWDAMPDLSQFVSAKELGDISAF